MSYKKVIENMLAHRRPIKKTTDIEDRIIQVLDGMGLEYVFDMSCVGGGKCYFCGKEDTEFSIRDISFHAYCIELENRG